LHRSLASLALAAALSAVLFACDDSAGRDGLAPSETPSALRAAVEVGLVAQQGSVWGADVCGFPDDLALDGDGVVELALLPTSEGAGFRRGDLSALTSGLTVRDVVKRQLGSWPAFVATVDGEPVAYQVGGATEAKLRLLGIGPMCELRISLPDDDTAVRLEDLSGVPILIAESRRTDSGQAEHVLVWKSEGMTWMFIGSPDPYSVRRLLDAVLTGLVGFDPQVGDWLEIRQP